ncbi:MAG: signal peptidase II [Rickettsiales bacterium]|nr:signal peptidase II [Rickettsiales bacterium]
MRYINKSNLFYYLAAISGMVVLDLYSKYATFNYLKTLPSQELSVFPFFNLVMVWNRGVSFGMFNTIPYAPVILSVIALLIVIFLFRWLVTTESKFVAVALSLVISGAFGNIIDRMINGAVADFLDFHIAGYHWPAFNLADSFVFVGAIMLIFEDLIIKWYKCSKK